MSKIVAAMRGLLKHVGSQSAKDALAYIETGDPLALGRIKPSTRWEYWAYYQLPGLMADPGSMDEEDRRALHALAAAGQFGAIALWLSKALSKEKPDEDFLGQVRDGLAEVNDDPLILAALLVRNVTEFARGGQPNSVGRHLLALSEGELAASLEKSTQMTSLGNAEFRAIICGFLLDFAPQRLGPLLDWFLAPDAVSPDTCETILRLGAERYEPAVETAWKGLKEPWMRFEIGQVLTRHDRDRYGREALDIGRAILDDRKSLQHHIEVGSRMLENFGAEVLDEILALLERTEASKKWTDQHVRGELASAAVRVLGAQAVPAVLAVLRTWERGLHIEAVGHLIDLDDGSHSDWIEAELRRGLSGSDDLKREGQNSWLYRDTDDLVSYIKLATRWKPERLADAFWKLLDDKSKVVREAAARALGRLGSEVVPRASEMLEDRKAVNRASAVVVLSTARSAEALQALERRLEDEPDEDIRDAMLLTLDAERGQDVPIEEIHRRIERAAPRLKKFSIRWLDESRLPKLQDRDGQPLGPEVISYLLYRQSRTKEIRADVEARPLFERIGRASGGEFALELLRQFSASKHDAKDRWVLAVSGILGDDRVVPRLSSLVQTWADSNRGKMAEYAVHALALLGSDVALTTVDAIATRYRNKKKNVGAAASEAFSATAERLGVSIDELGDRVVPWLGFEPGRPRLIEAGDKRFEVSIGPDFKLKYRDLQKNKSVASLPRSMPKEVLTEFKDLGASLREVAKAQKLRLENLLVRQSRWPVSRWRELFLHHPVLFLPFATRLIWGHYDGSGPLQGTFRALEDRSLTGADDEPSELPESGSVGMVHPLELDDESLLAWRTHLADYEVEPPFPQLDRPVARVGDDERNQKISRAVSGTSINALTFRGRAEKLGWTRGSVQDAGYVDTYRKIFPGAGVEAYIGVDGLYMGNSMDDTVQLQECYFVKSGRVEIGSYVYDNPRGEKDSRLIAFGKVPPVVYSEVVGDIRRIAGKMGEEGREEV